jgi:hypothetical protein
MRHTRKANRQEPSHWEAAEIQNDFQGKHWRDIIDPTFLREHRSLYYFSPVDFGTTCPPTYLGS